MRCRMIRIATVVMALGALGATEPARGGLTEAEFQKLHKELQITTKGVYQIPWRTSLHEARLEAAKVGKPVFMWMQDGNPLGVC